MVLLTVVAEGVLKVQAPPATTFLHERHFQIPAASRLTESFPQNYNQLSLAVGGYSTVVLCVLGDFRLLDLLSERCTVAGSVTTCAADFFCAFGHSGMFGGDVLVKWCPNRNEKSAFPVCPSKTVTNRRFVRLGQNWDPRKFWLQPPITRHPSTVASGDNRPQSFARSLSPSFLFNSTFHYHCETSSSNFHPQTFASNIYTKFVNLATAKSGVDTGRSYVLAAVPPSRDPF